MDEVPEVVYNNVQNSMLKHKQLENRTEIDALNELSDIKWEKIFGFDIHSVYHGILAVI